MFRSVLMFRGGPATRSPASAKPWLMLEFSRAFGLCRSLSPRNVDPVGEVRLPSMHAHIRAGEMGSIASAKPPTMTLALMSLGILLGAYTIWRYMRAITAAIIGLGLGMAVKVYGQGGAAAYPPRPPADPAAVARGKALYNVNCAFCHGEDARGGDSGPNLIRGSVLLNDHDGELLAPVLQTGRLAEGMPKFEFTREQVADIAGFLHSFRVGGYDISRNRPQTIVVGDSKEGEAYFKDRCASCHSPTGDLRG